MPRSTFRPRRRRTPGRGDALRAAALTALAGCGSGPALQPPPPPPSATHIAGGAILGACAAGETVAVVRASSLELWRFPRETPPVFVERAALGPILGPAVDHLSCEGGISVGREALRWRVDPKTAELVPAGEGVARFAPLPVRIPLGEERVAVFEPGRFGVTHPAGDRAWRAVSGPLNAATWDGEVIWAVGVSGLWRWRPGPGRPMAVPLPDGWAGRVLTGVFRDAQYLWVRDAAGIGVPLDVRAARPALKGEAGPLPVEKRDRRVAAGGRVVEGRVGENGMTVDGEARALDAPLDAMSPFRDGVLVVAGAQLRFWGGDGLSEVWRSPLPGATVALFALADGRVMAVGRRYGFLALDFRQALGR